MSPDQDAAFISTVIDVTPPALLLFVIFFSIVFRVAFQDRPYPTKTTIQVGEVFDSKTPARKS